MATQSIEGAAIAAAMSVLIALHARFLYNGREDDGDDDDDNSETPPPTSAKFS
jgi:hypothetical protein